jgi:hypothetical protein
MTHELWVLWIDGIVRNEWKIASAIRVIHKVTLSSPCLWASLTTYPLFQWYLQSKDILINLSMKWWYSAFNPQGSRLNLIYKSKRGVCLCGQKLGEKIGQCLEDYSSCTVSIVVVQLGAVRIYVAAVEALWQKRKTGWNLVCHQNWWFSEFLPPLDEC